MATVHPATLDDVPTIVGLLEKVERFYGTTEFDPWEQRADEVRAALFADPPAAYALLAENGGTVVGLAAYSFLWPAAGTSRSMFLKELFVAEQARGTGAGRALMRELLDIAAKTGSTRVKWQTDTYNPVSQRFYELLGVPPRTGKVFYRVTADQFPALLAAW